MSTIEHKSNRRDLALLLTTLGVGALVVGAPFGPRGIAVGVAAMVALLLVAMREARGVAVTWPNAIGALVAIVWLIPIKGYALPVDLPFNVEHYRLAILALALALAVGLWTRTTALGAGGRAVPVIILVGGAVVSLLLNADAIDAANAEPQAALKSLSYFLSFFIVFVLVCSVVRTWAAIDTVVRALVGFGAVVAVAAIYEARSGYNVFDHLHEWIPGFERQFRDVSAERAGRFRVYSSAQHPIALATVLLLVVPLAVYLSTRARTVLRSRLWLGVAGLLLVADAATISRTSFVVVATMAVVALLLRGATVVRFWPVLLILPFVIHFTAPGAMGGVYKAFFPEEGLVSELGGRAGEGGSGRFADIGPGLDLWSQKPLFGHGLGMTFPSTDASKSPGQAPLPLIFDNQYVDTLVKLGMVGLIGMILFFWGAAITLFRWARRTTGPPSDLLTACAVSAWGFAASLFLFDGVAFVQVTLVCILVIAIGFRCLALARSVPHIAPIKGESS